MRPFDYPSEPHVRRHGPLGYHSNEGYRDWPRDEFSFRCVFCLAREQWSRRLAGFHVDHFVPLAIDLAREHDYDNLLYVCSSCNALKGAVALPDPCEIALAECLTEHPNGTIDALNEQGRILLNVLRLDNDDTTNYRRRMLRIIQLAERFDRQLYAELMAHPQDLPDLRRKRPPGGNSRPDGIMRSYFARRARGELPKIE